MVRLVPIAFGLPGQLRRRWPRGNAAQRAKAAAPKGGEFGQALILMNNF